VAVIDYEGGICPCCGRPRIEYYVFRMWTCSDCDSWVVGVAHSGQDDDGRARWRALGRYPLGPMDDVVESVGSLVGRALDGSLGDVRDVWR